MPKRKRRTKIDDVRRAAAIVLLMRVADSGDAELWDIWERVLMRSDHWLKTGAKDLQEDWKLRKAVSRLKHKILPIRAKLNDGECL